MLTSNGQSQQAPAPFSLDSEGIFLLFGTIEDKICSAAMQFILEKNIHNPTNLKELTIIVNSYGGYVSSGFALTDIMMGSHIPIRTIALGAIASMGVSIFMAGTKGRRILTPNTMIMTHQFSGWVGGKEHELVSARKEIDLTSRALINHFKACTGQSEKVVKEKLLPPSDVWLSAQEAKKYGICDHVKDMSSIYLGHKPKK